MFLFHAVDTMSRRLAAITSFDKLAMYATGKLKLSSADIKDIEILGLAIASYKVYFKI